MALNKKEKKGLSNDLTVCSIGACITIPDEKKKPACVMIAYMIKGTKEVRFVMTDLHPKNKQHNQETLMQAIMQAEGMDNITYTDGEGRQKDIYFCRPASGKITDVIDRDYIGNVYKNGFSEMQAGDLKFLIKDDKQLSFKFGQRMKLEIVGSTEANYAKGTYEYATVNAFNACLLGNVFEREELYLETKDKRRIKIEVRTGSSAYIDESVLYIRPILREGSEVIEYYQTEEFNYIDGTEVSCRAYKINYTNRLGDYNLVRI